MRTERETIFIVQPSVTRNNFSKRLLRRQLNCITVESLKRNRGKRVMRYAKGTIGCYVTHSSVLQPDEYCKIKLPTTAATILLRNYDFTWFLK